MSAASSRVIPDLWPEEIVFTPTLSPLTILRHQAGILREKSRGVIEGEVLSSANGTDVSHELRLVAPSLDRYSRQLLRVNHHKDLPYPCKVISDSFEQDDDVHSPDGLIESLSRALNSGITRSLIFSLLARIGERAEAAAAEKAG